ncbi:hypothetical protein [uncultured Sphingomonas sp.]|uniref:hypothetical protein n=1 Tax=uncultured Sphingomonas sp. TaxID=158754 RepID=UPI0035CBFD4B
MAARLPPTPDAEGAAVGAEAPRRPARRVDHLRERGPARPPAVPHQRDHRVDVVDGAVRAVEEADLPGQPAERAISSPAARKPDGQRAP